MALARNTNYAVNCNFMQEMLRDSINVPVKLLREYEQIGLNETELVILLRLLQLYYRGNGLTLNSIALDFTLAAAEAAALIEPLLAKKIVLPDGGSGENYNLDGLFMQLYEIWMIEQRRMQKSGVKAKQPKEEAQKRRIAELGQLYRVFERELGRNLSPIENDKISQWMEAEQQSPELITEALRRAVLQGKPGFAYIDKILLNWRRQGIQSPTEIEAKDAPPAKKPGKKQQTTERVKDTWLDHYSG